MKATDSHDYKFSSKFLLTTQTVKPKSELTFDWGGLTQDFLKHPMDAKSEIKSLLMILWKLNLADLQRKLNDDTLSGIDIVGLPFTLATNGNDTTAKLFDFGVGGQPIDSQTILARLDSSVYPPSNYTYTIMTSSQGSDNLGQGVRMIQAFKLDDSSSSTTVKVSNDSTGLEYTADLHDLTSTTIPSGQAGIKLDWSSNITKNALGLAWDSTLITKVSVGHYTQTAGELETRFLDLDRIATDLYSADIEAGTTVDFSKLTTRSGKVFSGIDSSGTWLVALFCGACRNPAPWYLSILEPCSN